MHSAAHWVLGQALKRKGFDGFFRGGLKWYSDGFERNEPVKVTPALRKLLDDEPMIQIRDAEPPPGGDATDPYDVPEKPTADPEASAIERLAKAKRDNAALKARREAEELESENARLRASQPKVAKPKGPSKKPAD